MKAFVPIKFKIYGKPTDETLWAFLLIITQRFCRIALWFNLFPRVLLLVENRLHESLNVLSVL